MTGYRHGLYVARQLICPCGKPFVGQRPAATYCSMECRVRFTQYGRTYGQYAPRAYGVTSA